MKYSLVEDINKDLKGVLGEDISDVGPRELPAKGLDDEHEEWIADAWHDWAEEDNWKVDIKGLIRYTVSEFEDALEYVNEKAREDASENRDRYATEGSFQGDKVLEAMAKEFAKEIDTYKEMKSRDQKNWWEGLFKRHGRKVFFTIDEVEMDYDHPSLTAWERNR